MARQAALRRLEALPQTSGWKVEAALVLDECTDTFCASITVVSHELAVAMLDRKLQEHEVKRRVAETEERRAAEAKRRVAEAEDEARLKVAEATRVEAEGRIKRAAQDPPGTVAGPSAGGAVSTADVARNDQNEGKKLLEEFAAWVTGGKEKTL